MLCLPVLKTVNLTLRSFTMQDAETVYRLGSDAAIAANMRTIPHPYPKGHAEQWIASHISKLEQDEELNWAITLTSNDEIVGAIRALDVAALDVRRWKMHHQMRILVTG